MILMKQNQVAWGNGNPSNISDESVTHTVSMTDYPPLNRDRQNRPDTSTQRDPGLGIRNRRRIREVPEQIRV